jgi:hypothetical protein
VNYTKEMAIYFGLDLSFLNVQDWEGIKEKIGDVNNTEFYITN